MARARRKTYIREWRKFRDFTLEEVAEKAGITHPNLSRIERGLRRYNQDLLEKLADILGTDPGSLLNRDPFDLDTQATEVWANIAPEERERALEILRALARR